MVAYQPWSLWPKQPLNMRMGFSQGEVEVSGYDYEVSLRDDVPPYRVHYWLSEKKPDYEWCHNPHQTFFFKDAKVAMEFKLIWG